MHDFLSILNRELVIDYEIFCTYILVTEKFRGTIIKGAYSIIDGGYIGLQDIAEELALKGIIAERISDDRNVCSIGFSEQEQKWYGWSHRSMAGFTIGSEVTNKCLGYKPESKEVYLKRLLDRYKDNEDYKNVTVEFGERNIVKYGEKETYNRIEQGVRVIYEYSKPSFHRPERPSRNDMFYPFPDEWGKGEWVAKSLDDAKEMAIDFAECVA